MNSQWIIVYYQGNSQKLAVVEISNGLEHEINDYSVASSKRFHDTDELSGEGAAADHARMLADRHHLTFHHDGLLD
jgi:hypothetical protein